MLEFILKYLPTLLYYIYILYTIFTMHRQMNITSSDFTFTRNNDTQTSTQTQS